MTWNPDNYDDRAIGPLGLHDAYLLDAICRYVRPRVALEYGGLLGHSLAVMAPHCGYVISVDDNAGEALREVSRGLPNTEVVKSKMQEYELKLSSRKGELDLVFVDASHLYADCVEAYERFSPLLSDRALILVHDTGDWPAEGTELPPQWAAWVDHREHFLHHDRKFVRYLRTEGWSDVDVRYPGPPASRDHCS